MSPLEQKLVTHRSRIRLSRIGEAAAKGAFYASLAGCSVLVVCKLTGATLAAGPILLALAVAPLALAVRAAVRPFSLRDCAVHLDRTLGLEERLSTAVECAGAMGGAQATDAKSALASAAFPPRYLPREAKLLAGSGILLLVLMAIPAPEFARASNDSAHREFIVDEIAKLKALGDVDVEFKEASEMLEAGRPEEALRTLEAIHQKLMERMLQSGDKNGRLGEALEAAGARAQAVAAELARLGRTIYASRPDTVRMKLERHVLDAPDEAFDPLEAPRVLRSGVRVEAIGWSPRYEPVIRNYFRSRRER